MWGFLNEVASSGLVDCLRNYFEVDSQIVDVYNALNVVGEDELVALMEAAIGLLVEDKDNGGLVCFFDSEWCKKFRVNLLWVDLEKIQEASFDFADTSIFYRVGAYLKKHPELRKATES